ncbi:MAG TPA: hypothetical protein PKJ32_06985 [Piscinibacter sp.]|nr:hypothetical protein [Piscinibacter sp.]
MVLLERYAARICQLFGGYTYEAVLDVPWWLFQHMCQIVDEWIEGGGRG